MAGKNAYKQAGRELRPVVKQAVESLNNSPVFQKVKKIYDESEKKVRDFSNKFVEDYINSDPVKKAKVDERTQRLYTRDGGFTSRYVNPLINDKTLHDAQMIGPQLYPLKGSSNPLIDYSLDFMSDYYEMPSKWQIPMRSKNEIIDVISKEFSGIKGNYKDFVQNFKRKQYRKAGIDEKYIQDIEDTLDQSVYYVSPIKEKPGLGGSTTDGSIVFKPRWYPEDYVGANSRTVAHEFNHLTNQHGTIKGDFVDQCLYPGTTQNKIYNHNQNIIDKYKDRIKEVISIDVDIAPTEALKEGERKYAEYFTNPKEVSSNIVPLQMVMHEQGWQPKQMLHIIKSRGFLKNNTQLQDLFHFFGEDGVADLLTNILKNGGKIHG